MDYVFVSGRADSVHFGVSSRHPEKWQRQLCFNKDLFLHLWNQQDPLTNVKSYPQENHLRFRSYIFQVLSLVCIKDNL